jgi:hypothetical protein
MYMSELSDQTTVWSLQGGRHLVHQFRALCLVAVNMQSMPSD